MTFRDRLTRSAVQRGVDLGPEQARRMEVHYQLLVRWNSTAHLTSIDGEEAILNRHFLESLEALPLLPEGPGVLVDVGTGNGFPAIPLLILRPELQGKLLEPATRKRAFLKELLRETGLADRVEALPDRVDRPGDLAALAPFEVLTVRGVAGVRTLLQAAAAGLSLGGRAVFFLGHAGMAYLHRHCPEGLRLVEEIRLAGRDASFVAAVQRGE